MISVPLRAETGGMLAGLLTGPLTGPLAGPLAGPALSGMICVPRSETAPRCDTGDRDDGGP
jgi:hypothetical protein